MLNSEIIEIGAVKIQGGKVLSVFNEYVKPTVSIPQNITELTGIDDSMVADADSIDKVLPRFLEFIGNNFHNLPPHSPVSITFALH